MLSDRPASKGRFLFDRAAPSGRHEDIDQEEVRQDRRTQPITVRKAFARPHHNPGAILARPAFAKLSPAHRGDQIKIFVYYHRKSVERGPAIAHSASASTVKTPHVFCPQAIGGLWLKRAPASKPRGFFSLCLRV